MPERSEFRPESSAPKIFCLHALGSSAGAWRWVRQALGRSLDCVPLDLPGFGAAADVPGYDVAAMTSHVAGKIRGIAAPGWLLAGHSMGAKVALALARCVKNGETELDGLGGLVLLAGSPPSPEPMSESKRRDSLEWIDADSATRREKAKQFIAQNVGASLPTERQDLALQDILRANPAAWKAWFAHGSREDWSDRIGVLDTPTLVLTGSEDADLGADAQATLTMPHLARARSNTLAGAKHLLPLERPEAVADAIRLFAEGLGHPLG